MRITHLHPGEIMIDSEFQLIAALNLTVLDLIALYYILKEFSKTGVP
jgi:hypothetical protein